MRPRRTTLLIALTATALLLGACATVTRGPTETFVVRTTPEGAEALSTSGWECVTPCSVQVNRRGDFTVTLRKKGYVTKTVKVRSVRAQTRPGSRVNVDTGLLGTLADGLSGSNYEHAPNPIEVTLEEEI